MQLCQCAGLGDEPREVLQELADIALVDVVLPMRNGVTSESAASVVRRASGDPAATLQSMPPQLAGNGQGAVKTRACPH